MTNLGAGWGIAATLISVIGGLVLFFLSVIIKRIGDIDENINVMWRKVDNKIDKESCEIHRKDQTIINMEGSKQLAEINVKLGILLKDKNGSR